MLNRYRKNEDGNVAMMFGVASLMIMTLAGVAIDYSSMSKSKTKYQSMADAAVLMAAASGEEDPDILQDIAEKAVASHNLSGEELSTILTILDGNTIRVEVAAQQKMMIMDMFGVEETTIRVGSEAPPKGQSKLNLALVLDITDSMDGSKIDALRVAANDLVDTVGAFGDSGPAFGGGGGDDDDGGLDDDSGELDGGDDGGDGDGDDGSVDGGDDGGSGADNSTMISLIPFARYVKLPTSMASEPWLDVLAEESCSQEVDYDNSTGCTEEPYTSTWTDDSGVSHSSSGTSMSCTNTVYKAEVCTTPVWEGCVGSRNFPWNTRDYYGTTKIPAPNTRLWCDEEIVPLTSDVSAIKDRINDLDTNDKTYIPSGLVWGWRSLMPGAPLTESNTPDRDERTSAILLMTDGANTRSTSNGQFSMYHWDEDVDDANSITEDLCVNIKADGISIYTVAFEVTDTTTISMLRNCATKPEMFFDASSVDDLKTAFKDVGKDLAQIRLSK